MKHSDRPFQRLDVRFRHRRHDWLQMMIHARDDDACGHSLRSTGAERSEVRQRLPTACISVRISSVYCPFPQLLAWLDAIVSGVQQCEFEIEGEGQDAQFEWHGIGGQLRIRQPEDCTGRDGNRTWYERELVLSCQKRQVVSAFYQGFRRFAESTAYRPERYESALRCDEWSARMIDTPMSAECLIGVLSGLDAELVEFFFRTVGLPYGLPPEKRAKPWRLPDLQLVKAAFKGLLSAERIDREYDAIRAEDTWPIYRFLFPAWRLMDVPRRLSWLRELLRWPNGSHFGSALGSLRSTRIEAYLATPEEVPKALDVCGELFRVPPRPAPEIDWATFEHAVSVEKIISGGQAGVERAALDWAMARGYPHGGWCPKGRHAKDGVIPARYQLTENPTDGYLSRIKRNVRESDGTLIINSGELEGGLLLAERYADRRSLPLLVIQADANFTAEQAFRVRQWAGIFWIRTLNVTGPDQSQRPELAEMTLKVLDACFGPDAGAKGSNQQGHANG